MGDTQGGTDNGLADISALLVSVSLIFLPTDLLPSLSGSHKVSKPR